jgi:hypothetical protein
MGMSIIFTVAGRLTKRRKQMERLKNPALPDYRPKKEREALPQMTFSPCCVCGKQITEGFYGRWANGGTCSKTCETVQESKPKDWGEPK